MRLYEMLGRQAIIIKGNPKFTSSEICISFYKELEQILTHLGYSVSFDDGKPHTTPPIADLWIGHSRGCDRLQYAPKHTRTLAINGIHPVCSTPRGDCLGEINNPDDITVSSSWTPDQTKVLMMLTSL